MTPELWIALAVGVGGPTISGFWLFRIARHNKAVSSPADIREDDALHVSQYREQTETALMLAAETREQAKESLAMQKELLGLAHGQVISLTTTIEQLRGIIADLQTAHEASASAMRTLRDELARNIQERDRQAHIILAKEAEVAAKEAEIAALSAAVEAANN